MHGENARFIPSFNDLNGWKRMAMHNARHILFFACFLIGALDCIAGSDVWIEVKSP